LISTLTGAVVTAFRVHAVNGAVVDSFRALINIFTCEKILRQLVASPTLTEVGTLHVETHLRTAVQISLTLIDISTCCAVLHQLKPPSTLTVMGPFCVDTELGAVVMVLSTLIKI
jgi:hypothetical protein